MWIVNNLIDNLLLVSLIGNSLENLYFYIYISPKRINPIEEMLSVSKFSTLSLLFKITLSAGWERFNLYIVTKVAAWLRTNQGASTCWKMTQISKSLILLQLHVKITIRRKLITREERLNKKDNCFSGRHKYQSSGQTFFI